MRNTSKTRESEKSVSKREEKTGTLGTHYYNRETDRERERNQETGDQKEKRRSKRKRKN